ncbi:MAG: cytochrome b/b6 domain-containing protein [Desulfobacterales bacterium]|nr:MAG: cytochrome b/b6 domain-containing protein [Desulfobacterales bacterium]
MSPTAKKMIKRFTPLQRLFHLLLMLSFLIQSATGLARMYNKTPWGYNLGALFGGYDAARTVHIYVGIFMICGLAVHALYVLFKINWRTFPGSLFGPDSLLPRPADIKQFFQHIAWFLGFGKAPEFDRWGYWEKFDYWAVFWGMTIIGVTGLLMAYPYVSTRYMPGWGLNVAFWIHRIEAILAMGHLFIIHFFIAHLRRHNFPMDRTMFEGSADLEAARHERPAWIARLKQSGELEGVLVSEAMPLQRVVFYVFGFAAVAAGLFLLVGALINVRYISW